MQIKVEKNIYHFNNIWWGGKNQEENWESWENEK